jgi:hypothetical protein
VIVIMKSLSQWIVQLLTVECESSAWSMLHPLRAPVPPAGEASWDVRARADATLVPLESLRDQLQQVSGH